MSKYNQRSYRPSAMPVIARNYAPAGLPSTMHPVVLHDFPTSTASFDAELNGEGLGWTDLSHMAGAALGADGLWYVPSVALPTAPFGGRLRFDDGRMSVWSVVVPVGTPDGQPVHLNMSELGTNPFIPFNSTAAGSHPYDIVLDHLPPGSEVFLNGTENITRPGHWEGTSYVLTGRSLPEPITLRLNYPTGARFIRDLRPSTDAAFVADPSRFVVNAAPVVAPPAPVYRGPADLSTPTSVVGGTMPTVDPYLSVVGSSTGGSTGLRGRPPVGRTGSTLAPSASGTLRIWHMPEWGQVFLNDVLTAGSWEGGSPASAYYTVPISLGANSVRVVSPNGEQRRFPAVPSTTQPVVTLDYLAMTPTVAAGAPNGEVRVVGIPRGATLKIDGADVTMAPGARWVDAAQTIYGVPSPTSGHSIVVHAPNGEERQSTYTLASATTPLSLNYGEMRVTQAATGSSDINPHTGLPRTDAGGTSGGGAGSGSTPAGQTTVMLTGIPNTPTLRAFLLTAGEVSGANALDAINGTPGAWVTKFRTPGAIEFRTGLGGDVRDAIPTTGGTYEVRVIEGTATPAGDPVLDGWRGFRTVMSAPVTVATGQAASIAYAPSAQSGLSTTGSTTQPGTSMVVAGSGTLTITVPDTFLVTVDGATVSPNLIQSSGNPGMIDGRYVAPTGAFTQRVAMVAPGVHRVVVRDPSAMACYSDTQDITIASGVPASMDYTAPITSALQACAARQGGGTTAGGWAGLSAPAKMGVVGLGLAAVGGALWWFADSKTSKSARDDSDGE